MNNRKMRPKSGKTATDLARETKAKSKQKAPSKEELEEAVYKLEVSISASSREAREHYLNNLDMVPPLTPVRKAKPASVKPKLTYAQARAVRNKRMMEAAEFVVTFILIAGALSGLYKWWQMSQ